MITPSQTSLDLVREIGKAVHSPHQHHHILYDIAKTYPDDYQLNYVEIGCLEGASACLMLQRPLTHVITIDAGLPFSMDKAMKNMETCNRHNNRMNYVLGNSHDLGTKRMLEYIVDKIDILFIDGGHEYSDVIDDFVLYQGLVVKGGYIVFDDFNCYLTPGIRGAVASLNLSIIPYLDGLKNFEIIGTLENTLGAEAWFMKGTDGNCFIIRKS